MAVASLRERAGRAVVIGLPYLWLAVFFLLPFLMVLRISLSDPVTAQPPYEPVLRRWTSLVEWREFLLGLDFDNFETLWSDELYWRAALSSIVIALVSTAALLLVGYPVAYAMARSPERTRPLLLALVILPFWTSFLIRVYAWIAILKPEGLLNALLIWLGLIGEPLEILNTQAAVLIGLTYAYLPFMVLPLYAVMSRLDRSLR